MKRSLTLVPYAGLFGVVLLILYQAERGRIHPPYWPLLVLLLFIFVPPVRIALRFKKSIWALISVLPALAVTVFVSLGIFTEGRAFEGSRLLHSVLEYGGATLGEAQAHLSYKNQIEGQRVVMFFDSLETAERDLTAVDEHLEEIEKYTGRKLVDKIHFVRGKILGLEHQILLGLALGTKHSPKSWEKVTPPLVPGSESSQLDSFRDERGMLDRHELAHGFLRQFVRSDTSWPAAFSEGWAMHWSGILDRCWLIRSALLERKKLPSLRESIAGDNYLKADHKLYNFWGGFVFFLLEKFGFESFFQLYSTANRATFFLDVELVYGRTLETLEKEFFEFGTSRCQGPR